MGAEADAAGFDHPGSPDGQPVYRSDATKLISIIERGRLPHDPRDDHEERQSMLPPLRLPGFGKPLDDCDEFIPEALHFCTECYKVHEFPRNCMRYQCPSHCMHAVRRRAAGSKYAAGICPKLDALRRYLNAHRDDNQYYHHLTFEPPTDFYWRSNQPLERAKQTIRELMDGLGIQGLVAYHSFKGDHEDDDEDDRGKWKERLGHGRDWYGDVEDELKPKGHFHVVGVAPFIDLRNVGDVTSETGWVIKRITQENSNISIEDDDAMARAVTYCLSHAGVYETESGQKRLAAWVKGPDVNKVQPMDGLAERMKAIVNDVAENTLGTPRPSLECNNDVPDVQEASAEPADVGSGFATTAAAGPAAPGIHADGVGGLASAPLDLPADNRDADLWSTGPGSTTISAARATESAPVAVDPDEQDEPTNECGGFLEHISQAGEYLLDADRRERPTVGHDDELEEAYRNFVFVMTEKGRDPLDSRPEIPEFERGKPSGHTLDGFDPPD